MLVYDPINLEKIHINEYINNDKNNIVIIYDNKAYGVNKSMITINNEMKKCIIENNALLKKTTYDHKDTYYHIGFFFNKKVIVDLKTLNNVLKKKDKIFELTTKKTGDIYINKELLELTTIGLIKTPNSPTSKINFKYSDEDVYYDELISNVLKKYSGTLYIDINNFLLYPSYNNEPLVSESLINYVKNNPLISKKSNFLESDLRIVINSEIEQIDKAFMTAASRFEKKDKTQVFYRGMYDLYKNTSGDKLCNVGEKAHILNFTSVSSSLAIAKRFAEEGVIYKIYIEEGLPYINMISTTNDSSEKEYLLPRNIIFELIDKTNGIYTLLAKPFKPDQFKIKTGCIPLDFYNIIPSTVKILDNTSPKPTIKPISPIKPTIKPISPIKPTIKPISPIKPTIKPIKPISPPIKPIKPISPKAAITKKANSPRRKSH